MKVLDLYAGLGGVAGSPGGWSQAARERGHEVVTVELEGRFHPDIQADITKLTAADLGGSGAFDLVLASPPCESWSVMVLSRNWYPDYTPKSAKAAAAVEMVRHTLDLIRDLDPAFWIMENPRGMMRKHPVVAGLERRSVTYCHLWDESMGPRRMKPTDLWGGFPPSLVLPPTCRNGDPCHVRAPRGSMTGTQGLPGDRSGYWTKSLIPMALSRLVIEAAERDLTSQQRAAIGPPQLSLWGS